MNAETKTPQRGTSDIRFTPEQRQAIETVDRSVLVSAAAGSGKTAVLSERCAYLVCDAPPAQRCSIDELLVVTFTDNAAAEMKARIRQAVQDRARRRPHDARLRDQFALIDNARISTLHALGLWVLRRWFSHAGVDPAAPLLDEHEAAILKHETLERLLERLYSEPSELAAGFRALVEDYGLGDDQSICAFVLQLGAFLESLPNPQTWIDQCSQHVGDGRAGLLRRLRDDLVAELAGQIDYCRRAAEHIEQHLSDFAFYGEKLTEAVTVLEGWRALTADPERCAESIARIQLTIAEHRFSAAGAPRLASDTSTETLKRRDRARGLWDNFQTRLFKGRLRRVYGRFTPDEWYAGLDRIAPYVHTLSRLAERFRADYARAKVEAGVLDFADLERKTYDLLTACPDIAAAIRARYRYALVDEYQDINPIQEAIIRAVSREEDDSRADNLFVVGDVKQSIYRFRLAEPSIFLDRQARLSDDRTTGECIPLQRNYRSDPHVLDAVNLLFRCLLTRELGGIEYDHSCELRPGREDAEAEGEHRPRVEVHLLERHLSPGDSHPHQVDPNDPGEWSVIEREAFVIAERIREIVGSGSVARTGSALNYGDVAVLLRAAAHTAVPLARRLDALGVPARAEVGGELFSALEIRDCLSLLSVLDNARQDIPLAAVLRSPILGDALNEDELLRIRMIDREVPFCEAVPAYGRSGADARLRQRVARLLGHLEFHRTEARQRPLSEALWSLYHAHGYLAFVGGLPNGATRRANLLRLHEYARRFGSFQRQGLHRFLRFIDDLREQGKDLNVAPSGAASEHVVRVMSIHRSKGLEFPVVVVADLGRRFNLSDAAGRIIFDREIGIGLRAVDRERMIEYPSLAHHLASGSLNRHTRAEELRVLYVALTRAQHRLILVGSAPTDRLLSQAELYRGRDGPLPSLVLGTAETPLDWLVPALASMPAGTVTWRTDVDRDPCGSTSEGMSNASAGTLGPTFHVDIYDDAEMAGWTLEIAARSPQDTTREAVARCGPLPRDEPIGAPETVVDPILDRLGHVYAHLPAASVPAVVAATAVSTVRERYRMPDAPSGARAGGGARPEDAARTGVVYHRFLEQLDFSVPATAEALGDERRRLVTAGVLSADDAQTIDVDAIRWFLGTKLGGRIRKHAAVLRRELMFVHRRPASVIDPMIPAEGRSGGAQPGAGDSVLVRGIIDAVLPGRGGVEIIDYKTDRVAAGDVDERARAYAPQLEAYAAAAEALYGRPVAHRWLVFLDPRRIVDVAAG